MADRLARIAGDVAAAATPAAVDRRDRPAQTALAVDMRAVTAVSGLVEPAERDERVVRRGVVSDHGSDLSWHDDALRDHLRTAVAALTT